MISLKEAVLLAINSLEDKKGEDIKVIDIHEISTIGDYFIIASGGSLPQVHAMANAVDEALGRQGVMPKSTEGYQNGNWILMDYGDFIIHIFDKENRPYYDLERIWKDGKEVDPHTL